MIGRVAALFILTSQLLLVWVALVPNGTTAIWFSFAGTPCLVIGCGLGLSALRQRLVRDRITSGDGGLHRVDDAP